MAALWPVTFETDVVQLHRNLMHNQALNNAHSIYTDDARIESLVSALRGGETAIRDSSLVGKQLG